MGGLAGLLLIVGLTLGLLRRRRRHISTFRAKTKPAPFVDPSLDHSVLENRERDSLPMHQMPMTLSHFPSRGSSLPAVGGLSESIPLTSHRSERSRQEELLGLRSELEELRALMQQSTRIEPGASETSDLGAPPEYSSLRGDS